jgi:hypothetical protein
MKFLKQGLLLLTTLVSLASLHAQTADAIINKHINAMGGQEKLSKLKSIHMDMSMQMMGNDIPSSVTIVEGKGARSESDIQGQKIIQVITDTSGWMINPMMGATTPQPLPEEQVKQSAGQIYITGPFYNYAARGNKVELQGQEKVGDVNAYKLKLITKDSDETTYYIDPSTYYIIEVVKSGEMMGNPVTITVTNSDFQKTPEGYVVPHTVQTDMGGQFSLNAKITKVDINPPVDDSIFEMPTNNKQQ